MKRNSVFFIRKKCYIRPVIKLGGSPNPVLFLKIYETNENKGNCTVSCEGKYYVAGLKASPRGNIVYRLIVTIIDLM